MRLLILTLTMALSMTATAATKVYQHNAKWPTDKSIHVQTFTNPIALSTSAVVTGAAGPTSAAAATLTTGITSPDVPRAIYVTGENAKADINAGCALTISGTNIHGASISDTLTFTENQTASTVSLKAFKTVTSLAWAADCEDSPYGATWTVGVGESIGLNRCMDNAGDVLFTLLNGAKEGTGPTITADVDEVEKNTADFSGTMNGSNDFVQYYFHNYRCER